MSDPPTGFVRALFTGRVASAAILPYPTPDAETQETTEAVAGMVREWAAEAVDPEAIDREKAIPASVVEGMRELGLFGLTIPEAYGGAGCGQTTYSAVLEAIAHRCASTVTVLAAHLGIGMKGLLLHGTDAQRAKWLPALATGERIAAFALTEANAGSDAAALRTTADPLPDGSWRLSGRKIWITNGGIANFFTVFARTPDPERPDAPAAERPISAFVVPGEAAGLTVGAPEQKMGLCGSSTTEVGLEDVVVPADALLGPRGRGFKVALEILNSGRHGLAACCIGQAKLARGLAAAHAREREQFGRPIASFGMVQEMLAAMDADLYAMEAATGLTAGLIDTGRGETMLESACCKMYATERLWQIGNDALQVTGGTGFMREYPYERILRDARINLIFEGTNQVLRMMLSTQGLRAYAKDPRARSAEPAALAGVHPVLDDERRRFEALVPTFAARAEAVAREHGPAVREAQHDLRRLADMAMALYGIGAVLSRASARDGGPSDAELARARLAVHRLERDFRRTDDECESPDDALVAKVAGRMTAG